MLEQKANIGELCNGSTTDSDSVCEGSNPSSPAIKIYDGKPLKTLDFQGFSPFLGSDFRRQKKPKKVTFGHKTVVKSVVKIFKEKTDRKKQSVCFLFVPFQQIFLFLSCQL